jgi:hypothetical protein
MEGPDAAVDNRIDMAYSNARRCDGRLQRFGSRVPNRVAEVYNNKERALCAQFFFFTVSSALMLSLIVKSYP